MPLLCKWRGRLGFKTWRNNQHIYVYMCIHIYTQTSNFYIMSNSNIIEFKFRSQVQKGTLENILSLLCGCSFCAFILLLQYKFHYKDLNLSGGSGKSSPKYTKGLNWIMKRLHLIKDFPSKQTEQSSCSKGKSLCLPGIIYSFVQCFPRINKVNYN